MPSVRLALIFATLSLNAFAATANICDSNATFPNANGAIGAIEYAGFSTGLGNGFGGVFGTGAKLYADTDATGALALALEQPSCVQGANDNIVIYLDSRSGGFADTNGFTDNTDLGRAAVSGMGTNGSRAALTFAPGFLADFAIVIQPGAAGFVGLFELVGGAPHIFVKAISRVTVGCVSEFAGFTLADLGAQPGTDVRYVGTLLNADDATRSNELQGVLTAPAANIGIGPYVFAAGEWNVFGSPAQQTLAGPVRMTFENYAGTGFQPTPVCGQLTSNQWAISISASSSLAFGASQTTGTFANGLSSGNVTTGGLYAFTVATGNRAFGFQPSGTAFFPGSATLRLQNSSTTTFNGADLAYSIWARNDQGRSTYINLAWSTDGTNFVDMPALNYTSPEVADGGVFVQTPRSATVGGFSLAPSGYLYVRYSTSDDGGSGSRDELALDDITVTPRTNVLTDFGDAPATYGSAAHLLAPLFLGASVDGELANQPSAASTADDLAGSDDEDGVTFGAFRQGTSASLVVTANGVGKLSVWIDWNADGVFGTGELMSNAVAVIAGTNPITIAVPVAATLGSKVMRVRFSSVSPTSPSGVLADGEVEDYAITVSGCGDGVVNGGEQCDGASTGTCGCDSTCNYAPSSTPCGGTPSGLCDAQDACDGAGTCVAFFAPAATECHASNGACDVAETCTGTSAACPADGFASSGTCRASAGACDLPESCDGSGPGCPSDGFAATGICRASAGLCDVAESCNGSGADCPSDNFLSAATQCRAPNGVCDVAETCTGASAACPADAMASNTTVCRNPNGACDVGETCDGTNPSCPADGFASSGVCRPSNGACDVAESCNGSGPVCPSDGFASSGVCRPSNGACDVAESCNGGSAACPTDGFAASGECRPSNGACDVAESCNGSGAACPTDGFASSGVCRPANGVCDVAESCNGSGAGCPTDGFAVSGVCRVANGVCDVAESCNGSGPSCPSNAFSSSGVCRPANGACDVAESCNGSGSTCPADVFASSGECRASAGPCDLAESCTGSASTCPVDAFATSGTCRASAGPCDVLETCNGSGIACPSDVFAPTTAVCRVAATTCDVAERCSGSTATCPADGFAANGTSCTDSQSCNGAETCSAGVCQAGTPTSCTDTDVCTVDMCTEASGCTHVTFPGCCHTVTDCDDSDECTTDQCPAAGSMCTHVAIAGCGDAGVDGGVDGGEVDGGEADAGDVDGGDLDAGVADAGTGGGGGTATGGGAGTGGGTATGGGTGTGGGIATGGGATGGGGGGEMTGCNCSTVDPTMLIGLGLILLTTRRRNRRQ